MRFALVSLIIAIVAGVVTLELYRVFPRVSIMVAGLAERWVPRERRAFLGWRALATDAARDARDGTRSPSWLLIKTMSLLLFAGPWMAIGERLGYTRMLPRLVLRSAVVVVLGYLSVSSLAFSSSMLQSGRNTVDGGTRTLATAEGIRDADTGDELLGGLTKALVDSGMIDEHERQALLNAVGDLEIDVEDVRPETSAYLKSARELGESLRSTGQWQIDTALAYAWVGFAAAIAALGGVRVLMSHDDRRFWRCISWGAVIGGVSGVLGLLFTALATSSSPWTWQLLLTSCLMVQGALGLLMARISSMQAHVSRRLDLA